MGRLSPAKRPAAQPLHSRARNKSLKGEWTERLQGPEDPDTYCEILSSIYHREIELHELQQDRHNDNTSWHAKTNGGNSAWPHPCARGRPTGNPLLRGRPSLVQGLAPQGLSNHSVQTRHMYTYAKLNGLSRLSMHKQQKLKVRAWI